MKDFKFEACDFSPVIDEFGDREFITSSYGGHEELTEKIAERANTLLGLERAKWPVVYASQEGQPQICGHVHTVWHECATRNDTHQARLADIREVWE